MATTARMFGALLLTVAVLAGAAAALIWWAGWPLPRQWPTQTQWVAFAEQPLTLHTLKTVLAVGGWLLWLMLASSIGLEAWARLSRRTPPLVLPRPMRLLAAGMLGTGVVAVTTPASAATPWLAVAETVVPPSPAGHGDGVLPALPLPTTHADSEVSTGPRSERARADQVVDACRSVDLPGGWIVWPVATGVLAAVAATLLRSPTGASASALVRAIRAARTPPADPTHDEPADDTIDDIAALEHDAAAGADFTIGLDAMTALGLHTLPKGGIGIAGPGGHDALRGLLAAAACANTAVIIPSSLFHRLTGTHDELPALTTTAGGHDALHHLQMEIHRRYTSHHQPVGATPVGAPVTPLLAICEPDVHSARIAALCELGHDLHIRVIVAGPWPQQTWTVDPQGHARQGNTNIGRLNMLDPAALTQLTQALHDSTNSQTTPTVALPSPPQTSPAAVFDLRILGRVRLACPVDPDIHIRRSGSRQIAVYLALHPDGASREELLEYIFGHMTRSSATASLNTCLHELRKLTTIDQRSALLRFDDNYRLDPDLITVDWWRLLEHLQHDNLTQAAAADTDPLADGYHWTWLPEHRETIRHLLANARTRPTNKDAG